MKPRWGFRAFHGLRPASLKKLHWSFFLALGPLPSPQRESSPVSRTIKETYFVYQDKKGFLL